MMKPGLAFLLGLTLLLGLGWPLYWGPQVREPVSTVAQVSAGLVHDPRLWTGRSLRVRGIALAPVCVPGISSLCSPARAMIVDGPTAPVRGELPLAWQEQGPAQAFLRRVPLLGDLVPVIHWGALAAYRVRIRPLPCSPGGAPCFEVVVLGATPFLC
jgi:hypothetical protein